MSRWSPRVFVIGALVFVPLLAAGVYARWYLEQGYQSQITGLDTLAQLKVAQIAEWHRERLNDAAGRGQDPLFVGAVAEWRAGGAPAQGARIQTALLPSSDPRRYLNVALLDPDGAVLLTAVPPAGPLTVDAGLLAACRVSPTPVIGVVEGAGGPNPYLDVCVAVAAPGDTAATLLLMRANPSRLLMPTVDYWIAPQSTGFTMLVRTTDSGPEVVYSSRPQDLIESPIPRLPAGWLDGTAAGRGFDAAGVELLGAVRPIPGTSWILVLAVERSELQRPQTQNLLLSLFVGMLAVATAGLGAALLGARRQRQHVQQVLRLDRLLHVRSAINEAIVRIHERGAMLDRFCEVAVSLGRFDFAAVFEFSASRDTGRMVTCHGTRPARFVERAEFPVEPALRAGPLSRTLVEGRVTIFPDLAAEPSSAWAERVIKEGHRAVVGVPIREGAAVTGIFALYAAEPGVFEQRDVDLFEELSGDISFALENVAADAHRRSIEAQLQAVSDAAPFAIFLVAEEDQRIERANLAAVRQYGYSEAELIGQPATLIFSAADLATREAADQSVPALPVLASHEHRDGRPLMVEVTTRRVLVEGRARLVVVAVDVTERRHLEEQYRQAQRLEAIGQLAGGVAHDFNNLLTVIGGFSSVVLEDLPADSPSRVAAQKIKTAADRAAELTGRLLAFSRRQTLLPQRVKLNAIVRETAAMLERLIGENITCELTLDAKRDVIEVDPSQMQQVIMNLAVNARDAMRQGGRLTIATADRDGAGSRASIELRVSDTGTGIEPEVLEHMFEPFFTTKPSGEGTGLGLPTVHGIVTQSGGTLSVDTAPGRGTTFVMRFPLAESPQASEGASDTGPAPIGRGTILLVEDDAGVRALTRLVLERGGYTVIESNGGAAALDQIATIPRGTIALLLTDVVMPGLSGPELAEALRRREPNLKVLFMSGYAEDAAARLNLDLRTLDLMRKPFMPKELLGRVAAALSRA